MAAHFARAGRLLIVPGLAACLLVSAGFAGSRHASASSGSGPVRAVVFSSSRAPLTARTTAAAVELAASSGKPAEILPDRTDFSQTFAEPGGGFEAHEYLQPQRVQESDGSWAAVDPTLSVRPDGLLAPDKITTGLTLSDGGSGPLFTLSSGGESMAVSWPFGSLPVPTLSGSTATYAGVLPGVNLIATATPTGVSDLIEVTSPAAAANPDLAHIPFGVRTAGLSVTANTRGDLTAADSSGDPVFTAPAPQMWDSAGASGASGPSAPGTGGTGTSAARGQAREAGVAGVASTQSAGDNSGPAPGDAEALVGVAAGSGSVSLTPAPSVLAGPSVDYPVFIDPTWSTTQAGSGSQPSWGVLNDNNGVPAPMAWEPQDSNGGGIHSGVACLYSDQASGDCVSDPNASPSQVWTVSRAFLNFPVPSQMWGADIADAALSIFQGYSWGCSTSKTSWVTMWDTDNAGSNTPATANTTWPGPAAGNWDSHAELDYGYSNGCPGNWIQLMATQTAQAAAANDWPWLTLRLSATSGDESSQNQWSWKKFQATGPDAMHLDYFWRNAPDAPTHLGTQGVFNPQTGQNYTHCSTNQGQPDWIATNALTWQANVNDADSYNVAGSKIIAHFTWKDTITQATDTKSALEDGTGDTGGLDPNPFQSQGGATFHASFQDTPDQVYSWSATGLTPAGATDPLTGQVHAQLTGPRSNDVCYVATDTALPLSPPLPTSDVYVNGQSSGQIGEPGHFLFTDPNNSDPNDNENDVVGFMYGFSSSPDIYVPASGARATVTITPTSQTELDLYVRAVDRAGNLSPVPTTFFKIVPSTPQSGIAPVGYWPLNNNGLDQDGDGNLSVSPGDFVCSSPPGGPGPLGGTGPYTCTLAGSTGSTDHPVVGNSTSFSVSAWVYLPGQSCITSHSCGFIYAMAQQAQHVNGFGLGYDAACGCWAFYLPASDSTSAVVSEATSSPLSIIGGVGQWTQLTGVFDSHFQTLTLYVNGQQADQLSGIAAWANPAGGPLTLGSSPVPWYVSDACAYYGALSATDVASLYAPGSDGCAALSP